MRYDPSLAEPNLQADVASVCVGKEAFANGALAWRVLRRRKASHGKMRKDGHRAAVVFRCQFCAAFHIAGRGSTKS